MSKLSFDKGYKKERMNKMKDGSKESRKHAAVQEFYHYLFPIIKSGNIPYITLSQQEVAMADQFAEDRLAYKIQLNDLGYTTDAKGRGDSINASFRGSTGARAEDGSKIAFARHGIDVTIDKTRGTSREKNTPDIVFQHNGRTYELGVKACTGRNLPVISRFQHTYPQLFCYVENLDDGSCKVYLLGVGYPKILNDERNRSDEAVADPNMLYKKTGFKGFKWLVSWDNYISRIINKAS